MKLTKKTIIINKQDYRSQMLKLLISILKEVGAEKKHSL